MKTSADRAAARSKSRPRASISYPQRWRRTRRKAKAISRKLFALDAEGTCITDVTLVAPTQIRTAGERELSNRVSSRHRAIGFEHSLSDEPTPHVANRSRSASQARRAPQKGRCRSRENEGPCYRSAISVSAAARARVTISRSVGASRTRINNRIRRSPASAAKKRAARTAGSPATINPWD